MNCSYFGTQCRVPIFDFRAELRIRNTLTRIWIQIFRFSLPCCSGSGTRFSLHCGSGSDPATLQSVGNLRPLVYTPSSASFWASRSERRRPSTALHGTIFWTSTSFWMLTFKRILIRFFILMRIRIRLPKNNANPCLSGSATLFLSRVPVFSKNNAIVIRYCISHCSDKNGTRMVYSMKCTLQNWRDPVHPER